MTEATPDGMLQASPDDMRGRWAACAALTAAQGWPDHCFAQNGTWHFDDGGGNWADLRSVGPGRAVLVGHDHEYSETYFRGAAEYFGEPETDLLAGLPSWCSAAVEDYVADIERSGMWLGFVYAFDDGHWSRAPYTVPDGFDSLNLPTVDDDATAAHVTEFLEGIAADEGSGEGVDAAAVRAVIAMGASVDPPALRAMFGGRRVDIAAGVEAAARFAS